MKKLVAILAFVFLALPYTSSANTLYYVDPLTWVTMGSDAIGAERTGEGVCYDGASFWTVDDTAASESVYQFIRGGDGALHNVSSFSLIGKLPTGTGFLSIECSIDLPYLFVGWTDEVCAPFCSGDAKIAIFDMNGNLLEDAIGVKTPAPFGYYDDITWNGKYIVGVDQVFNTIVLVDLVSGEMEQVGTAQNTLGALTFNGTNFYAVRFLAIGRGMTINYDGKFLDTVTIIGNRPRGATMIREAGFNGSYDDFSGSVMAIMVQS